MSSNGAGYYGDERRQSYSTRGGEGEQPRRQQPHRQQYPPRRGAVPQRRTTPAQYVGMAALVLMVCAGVFIMTSGSRMVGGAPVQSRDISEDIGNLASDIRAQALTDSGVYAMKRTKIIPWNEDPCPEPDANAFSVTIGDDTRASEWSYSDETITVRGWTERLYNSKVYFSEVTIAHPSQLRTALANGSFPSEAYPSDMAKSVNAVIATNGDYTGYRESGLVIRQGVCYRVKQYEKLTWDVLLIDDKGNFHISDDRTVNLQLFADEHKFIDSDGQTYNIVNSLHFGPSLVVDGKKNILHMQSGCGNLVNETYKRSHTAIGQLGELHYLICNVEETDSGMSPESFGCTVVDMAQIMADKNCIQAYNLDGGQSTTLVFGGNTLNFVNRGGERQLSEIVYFASAQNA